MCHIGRIARTCIASKIDRTIARAHRIASLGQTVNFGQGLTLPNGTPTSFFVPSVDAFSRVFGFDCNCINKFGDFRLTANRSTTVGANFAVTEKDKGGYFQANFKQDIFDRPFSGNFGVRYVQTGVSAAGRTTVGRDVQDSNVYDDFLP